MLNPYFILNLFLARSHPYSLAHIMRHMLIMECLHRKTKDGRPLFDEKFAFTTNGVECVRLRKSLKRICKNVSTLITPAIMNNLAEVSDYQQYAPFDIHYIEKYLTFLDHFSFVDICMVIQRSETFRRNHDPDTPYVLKAHNFLDLADELENSTY